MDFIKNTDWAAVAKGMGAIVQTLVSIVGLIGQAAGAWQRWQLQKDLRLQQGVANGWFVSSNDRQKARWKSIELQGKLDASNYQPPKATAAPAKAVPSVRPQGAAKPLAGNVKVDVNVKASGGAQVQSTRVSSNDRRVQPSVRTGRAMAEVA